MYSTGFCHEEIVFHENEPIMNDLHNFSVTHGAPRQFAHLFVISALVLCRNYGKTFKLTFRYFSCKMVEIKGFVFRKDVPTCLAKDSS